MTKPLAHAIWPAVLVLPLSALASMPHPEDWEQGTDLPQFLLLGLALFLLSLPFFIVRGWIKRERVADSIESASGFAFKGATGIVMAIFALVFVVGIPFGVFNLVWILITGKQLYWPIIVPGLALLYVAIGGFALVESRREKAAAERDANTPRHRKRLEKSRRKSLRQGSSTRMADPCRPDFPPG